MTAMGQQALGLPCWSQTQDIPEAGMLQVRHDPPDTSGGRNTTQRRNQQDILGAREGEAPGTPGSPDGDSHGGQGRAGRLQAMMVAMRLKVLSFPFMKQNVLKENLICNWSACYTIRTEKLNAPECPRMSPPSSMRRSIAVSWWAQPRLMCVRGI